VSLPPKTYPELVRYKNLDEFHDKLMRIMYRVRLQDVMPNLPPQRDETLPITLSPVEQKAYRALEAQFKADLATGTVTPKNGLVRLLRLQEMTSGYVRQDDGERVKLGSSKAEALQEWLTDLPGDEPVVVFCRFRHDLDQVRAVAAALDRTYAEQSGRVNEIKAWQAGERTILGVQIQSGSEGQDMVRAHYVVYFSIGLDLKNYLQSRRRVWRPGQTQAVLYVHLLVKGSIDERVYHALLARDAFLESVLAEQEQHGFIRDILDDFEQNEEPSR
jgi:SNF2 family DNA or RNA helicase